MSHVALITGITGQDGSYLAELLLDEGYEVHGLVRRVAQADQAVRHERLAGCQEQIYLHGGDVADFAAVCAVVQEVQPDECYHLAAQSDVGHSFKSPFETLDTNVTGTLNVLEALHRLAPECRVYFAASSEMFGKVQSGPQDEATPFHPRSPYGVSKVAGYWLTRNYREAYHMHASCGIMFNHESPRRGREFVTRKITAGVAAIKAGKTHKLYLGNTSACRDWGYAGDYVRAMWLMLQQPQPDDFVIATGETHSVDEFCDIAFRHAGLEAHKHVRIDPEFYRPAEVQSLWGNPQRAEVILGWKPRVGFEELVRMMVDADMGDT